MKNKEKTNWRPIDRENIFSTSIDLGEYEKILNDAPQGTRVLLQFGTDASRKFQIYMEREGEAWKDQFDGDKTTKDIISLMEVLRCQTYLEISAD